MAVIMHLDLDDLKGLFNVDALYQIVYSLLFGSTVWVSFVGGVIALKSLPRHQFGALQAKTFPVYFTTSLVLSATLLGLYVLGHPDVISSVREPWRHDVAQAYALAFTTFSQALNLFIIAPATSKVMFQRHRLEKEESKAYNDPTASTAMKKLNSKFGALHGISSLANLLSTIALLFHGLWIGTYGYQKY